MSTWKSQEKLWLIYKKNKDDNETIILTIEPEDFYPELSRHVLFSTWENNKGFNFSFQNENKKVR